MHTHQQTRSQQAAPAAVSLSWQTIGTHIVEHQHVNNTTDMSFPKESTIAWNERLKKKTSLPHQYITIPRFISAACTQFKSVVHVHVTQFRTQGTNYDMLHKSQYMYEHDVSQNQTLVPQLHVWCRAIIFNWKLHKGKTVYTLITLQVFLHYMYNDRTLWLQLAATLTSGIAAWQHVTWRIASLLVSNMISVPVTSPRHVIVSSNAYMYILQA